MNEFPFLLKNIAGRWTGFGKAEFPTTDSFDYEEETVFQYHPDKALVSYLQQTWIVNDYQRLRPSHAETGFISITENGLVLMNNAQSGGRTEVLSGRIHENQIILSSDSITNDPRVQGSGRTLTVEGDTITYTMTMKTDAVESAHLHLEAKLYRILST